MVPITSMEASAGFHNTPGWSARTTPVRPEPQPAGTLPFALDRAPIGTATRALATALGPLTATHDVCGVRGTNVCGVRGAMLSRILAVGRGPAQPLPRTAEP